ncbi:phosphocholine-specific phospholipase C [Paracidobacterium acidisoli]|uniref:phospholipase C n=1 Tax=Paracidobacterium acidisoli TaxID=2303751 RepID=A0A372IR97_9BACT|nr:phospholipase C, phosphocholine-specific [Paracidobacterium acidisoli]MBT9330341.1 phospholipase C, phosphocholine-specific [Paracidobacterium acidisoli]
MSTDRRSFLKLLTTGALSAAFPASISRALQIPAHHQTGTIDDVQHIVFMMQENRSFDHYFGTLRGVRGFGDPRTVRLPSGQSVWYQPDPANPDGYVLPFHPGAPSLGLQFIQDLAHDWTTTHAAWDEGKHDQWVPQKGTTSMAHLTRSDIPFHYALADAFTVCDAYHCSLLGPTDPNRYHMWTGWVGNDGQGGGPVIDNAEAGYDWSTFPEILEKAGVSWKIYQDVGLGLNASEFWGWTSEDAYIGNYGDNSLLYFHQYQNAQPGSPLANGAKVGTDIAVSGTLFDLFRQDIRSGNLPQVSWVVAPEAYTEHPNWPANYGAWYVSQILDALTENPDVWSKTVFFLMYDENDGFFDHAIPPTPPQTRAEGISTVDITNEIFPGDSEYPAGPYGLGVRVPMVVISPWSKGGWINSQVFDHTSLIRFVEERFGLVQRGFAETNITKWRRAVTGDLTSAFNFTNPNDASVPLPSTTAYIPPDNERHPDYVPVPPTDQALPAQEQGTRPARALPYELHVHGNAGFTSGVLTLDFRNSGTAAAVFHVRSGSGDAGPWTYTVSPGTSVQDSWPVTGGQTEYDLSVYGPNGFLRAFRGSVSGSGKADLEVEAVYDRSGCGIALEIRNRGQHTTPVTITDAYSGEAIRRTLHPGTSFVQSWALATHYGWYDLIVESDSDSTFRRQLAGHVETGRDSMTDPAIGKPRA